MTGQHFLFITLLADYIRNKYENTYILAARVCQNSSATCKKGYAGTSVLREREILPVCSKSSSHFKSFGRVPREDAQCFHCGALERHRLLWFVAMVDGKVTFTYRDRGDKDKAKELTVTAEDLPYLLHILPSGFMKIRYFGFLANTNKKECVPLIQQLNNPHLKITEYLTETIQEMMLRITGNPVLALQWSWRCGFLPHLPLSITK